MGSEGASVRALMQERDSVDSGGVTLLVSARVREGEKEQRA